MCDICGIERKIFEKRGVEFTLHKMVEHNLWDYVFYLVYLRTLDEQSLTGFEYFVLMKFQQRSTVWLPVGSTLFLKSTKGETEDENLNMIQKEILESNKKLEAKMEERHNNTMKAIKELKVLIASQRMDNLKIFDTNITKDLYTGINRLTDTRNSLDDLKQYEEETSRVDD